MSDSESREKKHDFKYKYTGYAGLKWAGDIGISGVFKSGSLILYVDSEYTFCVLYSLYILS